MNGMDSICSSNGTVSEENRQALSAMESLEVLSHAERPSPSPLCDVSFLANLTALYINHAGLTSLNPEVFAPLTKLRMINAQGNEKLDVIENLCIMEPTLYLDTDAAMFVCDCNMRYLFHAFYTNIQPDDKICKSPANMVNVEWRDLSENNFTCTERKLCFSY